MERSALMATLALSIMSTFSFGQQPAQSRAVLPPNTTLKLDDGTIFFSELELNDGDVIYFDPTINSAEIVVQTLTLHGKSTIDLSPTVQVPGPAGRPATPTQARNDPPTQRGSDGTPGANGQTGAAGTALKLSVVSVVANDGSLWIKTDGGAGEPGGPGGDGAKGAGPLTSGVHCYDGGAGGNGGRGGNGGKGGNTSKVTIKIADQQISGNRTPGVAPSLRPISANLVGAVVAAGSPGAGAQGGVAGNGGPGGEGRSCHFPASDAHPGPNGHKGTDGTVGAPGDFVP